MSLDIKVYCQKLSDNLIPKIVKELNRYEMQVEISPDFSFSEQTGFLPFKFQLENSHFEIPPNIFLKSGFELYIEEFDLKSEKDNLKPKLGFFDKLFKKEQPEMSFAPEDVEKRLKYCDKVVTFIWHSVDSFELRFAALTSAILTDLTGGVCCYPADDIWYDNENIVNEAFKEIKEYEHSLKQADIHYHEFDEW